jgi:type IV pilus assembly protein PilM
MFTSPSHYIGFDVARNCLRIAKLRKTRQGWDILLIKEILNKDQVRLFDKHLSQGISISAVQTRDVLCRHLDLPLKKPKDVFAALNFHIEPLMPYPLDKAIIQSQITSQQDHSTSLAAFAVRKDHLEQHLNELKTYGIEAEITTTKAHALAALAPLLPQTGSCVLIVHESEEEITLVLTEKGEIIATRGVENKPAIGPEIQKALLTITTNYKSKIFDTIYFFGKDLEIQQAIQKASGQAILSPTSSLLSLTQEELIHYGLAIGCALAHQSVNFRQKEFAYPRPFRQYKQPLIAFFSLSLFFALSLSVFSQITLTQKKQALSRAYTALLESEGKLDTSVALTPEGYLSSLSALEQEIKERPETFPLLPQIPKVREILGWLASAPEAKDLTLESLHYQFVKRPDFSNRYEKYKVRVELEFSGPNANSYRLFQEALKNPKFVDTTEEIQWVPSKGKYKASFYLRDQTKYD